MNYTKSALRPGKTSVMMEPIKKGKMHYVYRSDGTIMEAPILEIQRRTLGNQVVTDGVVFDMGVDGMGNQLTKTFSLENVLNINRQYIRTFESTYNELMLEVRQIIKPAGTARVQTAPFRRRMWEHDHVASQARHAAEQSVFDMPCIKPIARRNYIAKVAEKEAAKALQAKTEAAAFEAEEAARAARLAADRARDAARDGGRVSAQISDIDRIFTQYKGNETFMHHYRRAMAEYEAAYGGIDRAVHLRPDGVDQLAHAYSVEKALELMQ